MTDQDIQARLAALQKNLKEYRQWKEAGLLDKTAIATKRFMLRGDIGQVKQIVDDCLWGAIAVLGIGAFACFFLTIEGRLT